ncbi:Maf family protein [Hydrogenispora ethanolica]|nr:Maf family protein [Hydrogenispora ethanolica]
MKPLILASTSPRRAELLRQIGVDFQIIPSQFAEEPPPASVTPREYVIGLASHKAGQVAASLKEGIVIGADTVVVSEGVILGKPEDPAQAVAMLTALSGKEHSVFTGVACLEVPEGNVRLFAEETKVTFRRLQTAEIQSYVATGEPLDKAGAYGIQGKGALLVEQIQGCYFNVVGLPLSRLAAVLAEMGVAIW